MGKGEVATTLEAFRLQYDKAFVTLCQHAKKTVHIGGHDTLQSTYVSRTKVDGIIDEYSRRLPSSVMVPKLLDVGSGVRSTKHIGCAILATALDSCYVPVARLKLFGASGDRVSNIQHHVEACIGIVDCQSRTKLDKDPKIRQTSTAWCLCSCLKLLQHAIDLAVQQESLHRLVITATVLVLHLGHGLLLAKHAQETLPYILHAIIAMEAHSLLQHPKYLSWRCKLVALACMAYRDLQEFDAARSFIQHMADEFSHVRHILSLDFVPISDSMLQVLKDADESMIELRLMFDLHGCNAADVAKQLTDAGLTTEARCISALLASLPRTEFRNSTDASNGVVEELQKRIANVVQPALAAGLPDDAEKAQDDHQLTAGDENPCSDERSSELLAAEAALPLRSHIAALVCAHQFGQPQLLYMLKKFADIRLSGVTDDVPLMQHLKCTSALLCAADEVRSACKSDTGGGGSLTHALVTLAAQLIDSRCTAADVSDVYMECALLLWEVARPLVDGVSGICDREADTVVQLLRALHTAFDALDYDDYVLRLYVDTRLALLLRQSDGLLEARSVLKRAVNAATAARCETNMSLHGSQDEQYRHICASRSHPVAAVADAVADMPAVAQVLAALHHDALMLLFGIELDIGVQEQADQVQRSVARSAEALKKRRQQVKILGTLTTTEQRKLTEKIARCGIAPPHPARTERQLLKDANKNAYHRALIHIQTALLHNDQQAQAQLLHQAAHALQECEALEEWMNRAATATAPAERPARPPAPLILNRGSTSVDVSLPPMQLRGGVSAAYFAVYCKPFGAGVELTMNPTATQYEGTGVQVPVGQRATIANLRPNDTYIFAIAAYDDQRTLIGGLGEATGEVLIALPLPTMYTWAFLLQQAYRLNLVKAAAPAVTAISQHFIIELPALKTWEAHPMDTLQLNQRTVAAASPPLLRAFALAVYTHAGRQLERQSKVDGDRCVAVQHHTARLVLIKLLLIGLQAAAYAADDLAVSEGVVLVHNALLPLLSLPGRPAEAISALMHVSAALRTVHNLVQDSLEGQEAMRENAARAAAVASLHLFHLARRGAALEGALAAEAAALKPALLSVYDPRCETVGRAPHPTRVLAEVEALQEMLLLHSSSQALVSEPLLTRAADSEDLVAQTLFMLASKSPVDVWGSLQTEGAKGHSRWPELCARCIQTAFVRKLNAPFQEWAEAVMLKINSDASMPPVTFRRLPLDTQIEFVGEVDLDEDERAEARQQAAASLGIAAAEVPENAEGLAEALEERRSRLKMRHVAARVLQARIPAYLQRGKARVQKRQERQQQLAWAAQCWSTSAHAQLPAARAAAQACANARRAREQCSRANLRTPDEATRSTNVEGAEAEGEDGADGEENAVGTLAEEARQQLLGVLRSVARAANLASRCGSWLQVANAAIQAWNAIRALCDDDPRLFDDVAAAAEWTCVPHERPDEQADAPAEPEGAGASEAEVPEPAEGEDKGAAAGPHGRWECTPAPESVPRLLRSVLEPLLELTSKMKCADAVLATSVMPMAEADMQKFAEFPGPRPRTPGAPESVTYAGSVMSLGSDRPASLWFLEAKQLDFDQLTQVVLAGVTALLAGGRPAAALDVGVRWSEVTDGAFDEGVMPLCLQAAPRAGVDVQPFASALAIVVRGKREALCTLETVRHAARALGVPSPLAATPAPKLKKARSVKASTMRQGSVARSRMASSLRSGMSSGTLADEQLMARYTEAIAALQKVAEKEAQAQASSELGDIWLHHGDVRQATTAWHDCLDLITGPYQAIKTWRDSIANTPPAELLAKHGVRTLLFTGACLCGKLARVSYALDLHLQREAALLGATLLAAVLPSSLSHPQRAADAAEYTPVALAEGSNLFRDPYALNMPDLLEGLETVARVLTTAGQHLAALPVLSMWEWAARHVSRSQQHTVRCRIVRVHVLCDLGLLREAARVTSALMRGAELPDPDTARDAVFYGGSDAAGAGAEAAELRLRAALHPGAEGNRGVMNYLMCGEVPKVVAAAYGQWASAHVALARVKLLSALACVPYSWDGRDPAAAAWQAAEEPPPAKVEERILQRALQLLQTIVEATSRGEPVKQPACEPLLAPAAQAQAPAEGKLAKGGKGDAKGPAKKGAAAPAAETPAPATGPPDVEVACTLEAWHVDVLAQARAQAAEVLEALWQPAAALRQLHLAMAFLHRPGTDATNGLADTPADTLAFTFGGARWLALLDARCRMLLQLQDGAAAAAAAQAAAECAVALRCRRSRAVACAAEAAAHAQRGSAADALRLYGKAQSTLAAIGDTSPRTAEVLLAHGDLRCALGMRAEAQQLWSLAADMLRVDAVARGLPEELAAPERVNIYATDRGLLVRALLCAARAQLWSGKAAEAEALAAEADVALPVCRIGPDAAALVHLLRGRLLCCALPRPASTPVACMARLDAATAESREDSGGSHSSPSWIVRLQDAAAIANRECSAGAHVLRDALLSGALMHILPGATRRRCSVELPAGMLAVVQGLLRAVSAAGAARTALQGSARVLGSAELAALPVWFVAQVRGADERHVEASHRMKAAAASDEWQEAVWPCFWRLCCDPAAGTPCRIAISHALQQACVHRALAAAVPQYKETCCLPCIPPLAPTETPAAAPDPAADGSEAAVVMAQWLREEVGADASTEAPGKGSARKAAALPSGASVAQVLQVPHPQAQCTLIFVCEWPGEPAVAEGVAEPAGGGEEGADEGSGEQARAAAVSCAGTVSIAESWRWSTLQQVRRVRALLEACASGTEGLLLRPAMEGPQPRAGTSTASEVPEALLHKTLTAVAKLLWRVTPDDETDPDVRAAVAAALALGETTVQAAGEQAPTSALIPTMLWPQMDLGFWQNIEAMLDVESGIVLEREQNFIAWFASVIKSQPIVG
eukprot:jgi/Ulvmu1/6969/UM033_0026.1